MDDDVRQQADSPQTSERDNFPVSPPQTLSITSPNEGDSELPTADELAVKTRPPSGDMDEAPSEEMATVDEPEDIVSSEKADSIQKDENKSLDSENTQRGESNENLEEPTETQLSVQDTGAFDEKEQRIDVQENDEPVPQENIEQTVKHKANGNLTSEPASSDTGQLPSSTTKTDVSIEMNEKDDSVDCLNSSVHDDGENEKAEIAPVNISKEAIGEVNVETREIDERTRRSNSVSDKEESMDVDHEIGDKYASDRDCRKNASFDDNTLDQRTEPNSDDETKIREDETEDPTDANTDAVTENCHVNGSVTIEDVQESDRCQDDSDGTAEETDSVRHKRPRSISPTGEEIEREQPSHKHLKLTGSSMEDIPKTEPVLNGDLSSAGEAITTIPATTEPLAESEKFDHSADSGKSSLDDSIGPEQRVETPKTSILQIAHNTVPTEKSQSDAGTVHDAIIKNDDLDDEKSSSSSSQSSSSSSSSASDSSDDEASKEEEDDDKSAAKVQSKQPVMEPEQEQEKTPTGIAAGSADLAASVAMENNDDSQSRQEINDLFSQTSEEYEEVDEDDELDGNESENDAKITKSEGLKLSISLKRSATEDSTAAPVSVEQLPPTEDKPVMPQPVDFSNFLSQEKLFGERSELIKIDYNSKPQVHNLSDQVKKMESEMLPVPESTACFNLLSNQFKTNYVGLNSADFLMDESSDTLDEDNRLVIAEKQRRGRKKDNSLVKQPQLQQQHQAWLQTSQNPQLVRLGTTAKTAPTKRPYQQRSQPSLMKTMLARSKITQQHLPIPPALPPQLPLQPQHIQQPPLQQQQQQQQQQRQSVPQQQQPQPQPAPPEKKKDKKKVFLCSPCGTHYENWNLFKHMREVHKKYICLYCLGIFQSAERLVTHLEVKHQVRKKHMSSIDDYQSQQQQQNVDTLGRSLYLMCARCEHIFERTTAADEQTIVQHECANFLEKCDNCGNLKQSKHKCEKKSDILSATGNAAAASTRSFGSNQKLINNTNNKIKFSLNNNYDSTATGSSSAVMFNYDNHGTYSNTNPDNLYQPNQQNSLGNVGKHTNATNIRKSSNKKIKLTQRSKPADLTSPLEIHTQLLVNLPSGEDHSSPMTSGNSFNSPILQSQLMKPLETMPQLPASVAYTSEQSQYYTGQASDQPFLIQLPSQLMELPTQAASEQKFSFNETAKLSTIPASLLNVSETPVELPPVPELPSQIGQPMEQQPAQEQPPLLVPKLKVKIPKQFCTPIESEESSTESDYEDDEPTEENEDGSGDTKSSEPTTSSHTDVSHTVAPTVINRIEDDVKLDPVEMDIEEEGDRQPVNLPPEMGPAPMPERHRIDAEQLSLGVSAPESTALDKSSEVATVSNDRSPASTVQNVTESEDPQLLESELSPDAVVVADDDAQLFELTLDEPLDKIEIRDFIKLCLKSTVPFCLYCNHARRIAVNGKYLALHLVATHRFQATVNSITAEELLPATIVQRFKSCLEELEPLFFNLETFDSSWTAEQKAVTYPKQFECFQCRFITKIHKELYLHNRKMHQKSLLICLMCKANFFSYSELLCHMCPGAANRLVILDYSFRCSLCNIDGIPSAFRLMVHLRKRHFACDVCLEQCSEQGALSNHVWKHKLHHLCYRCGIAYRNKADILKHLFWKHGTEGVVCKRCLQKKWPHVYHFCVPPAQFICEVCQMGFRKSLALKVHQRLHNGEEKYPCTEDGCEKKFISKKLLLKHVQRHYEPEPEPLSPAKPVKEPTPEPESSSKSKQEDKEKPASEDVKPVVKDEVIDVDGKVKVEIEEEKSAEVEKQSTETPQKKKKKRSKENQEKSLTDLINLPALNLSESDSSDESDGDQSNVNNNKRCVNTLPVNESSGDERKLAPEEENPMERLKASEEKEKAETDQVMTIWNNFKNYQASRNNSRRPSLSDELTEEQFIEKMLKSKILHVSQSDHDYCRMTKKVYPQVKAADVGETIVIDDNGNLGNAENQDSPVKSAAPSGSNSKKQKSPRKRKASKSGTDSSSSDSGSDSDSSCECGSNCSCSSSSSGSSSSSSDDSGSSDENAKKNKIKEVTTLPTEQPEKDEPSPPAEEEQPVNPPVPVDPDTIIHESDLETDESETDEEFYDDHPQKLANQMLAEKRRQLLLQTCMSPLNSYGIVENSRPSTPSLPPEEQGAKKKVKLKKRKRERKYTKKTTARLTPQELSTPHIPPPSHVDQFSPPANIQSHSLIAPPMFHSAENAAISVSGDHTAAPGTPLAVPAAMKSSTKIGTPRLSTGNSSESDAPLKRSQRSRKPNKFYGYTSDEETPSTLTPTMASKHPEKSILSVMKPTPPPNLVWSKDDLPSPTITKVKTPKVKQQPEPHTPLSSRGPPLPTPTINPVQQPPRVEATKIPQVPVHHIYASPLGTPQQTDADSDSSQEGVLQINQKPIKTSTTPHRPQPPLPKLKLSISKRGRGAPKTPASTRKRGAAKPKTPKSAPPAIQPIVANRAIAAPVAIPHAFEPPIIDSGVPKIPPLGSFPSITTEFFPPNQIRIPAGWRPPREGESVYCYCRCPYDEVSEMIACDGDNCRIEWFHFECVGIIMPPKGKWFCPECKLKQTVGGVASGIESFGSSGSAAVIPATATLGGTATNVLH